MVRETGNCNYVQAERLSDRAVLPLQPGTRTPFSLAAVTQEQGETASARSAMTIPPDALTAYPALHTRQRKRGQPHRGWFSALARKALKGRTRTGVADLIDTWISHWNQNPQPLACTTPANDITAKTRQAQTALTKSETHH